MQIFGYLFYVFASLESHGLFYLHFTCGMFTFFLSFYNQRDANGITAENSELKLRLQTMEQQVHLQDGKGLLPCDCFFYR